MRTAKSTQKWASPPLESGPEPPHPKSAAHAKEETPEEAKTANSTSLCILSLSSLALVAGSRRFKEVSELSEIHSPEGLCSRRCHHMIDLIIDYDEALRVKRGDLAVIQGETFRCRSSNPALSHIPLIIKRLQCIDRRTYDFKVYEADQLRRLRGHPNIISLYSYWSEKSESPYIYKVLVLLLEAGPQGNVMQYVQEMAGETARFILKCAGDIAKGLAALHASQLIHGGVRPSSIYVAADGTLLLGELCKAELDSAKQTHQLFSKVMIGEAMENTLVYWAPELLLKQEGYTKAVDLWALGVTIYELATHKHPFRIFDESAFREDVASANVDYSVLSGMPEVQVLVGHLLVSDPAKRWEAQDVLAYIQSYLVVDIQRRWRGCINL